MSSALENIGEEVQIGDLVSGQRYLMVDTNHGIVVTAIARDERMMVVIEKSFLVGFFEMCPVHLPVDRLSSNVRFFIQKDPF